VWWTFVPGDKNPIVVLGKAPVGAEIKAKGKGSAYETAQSIQGTLPQKETREIGFQNLTFKRDSSPGNIDVDYKPDENAIGKGKRSPFPLLKHKGGRLPR
jgi:hypothetical protein